MSNGLTKPLGSDPGLRQKLDRVAVSYLDVFKDILCNHNQEQGNVDIEWIFEELDGHCYKFSRIELDGSGLGMSEDIVNSKFFHVLREEDSDDSKGEGIHQVGEKLASAILTKDNTSLREQGIEVLTKTKDMENYYHIKYNPFTGEIIDDIHEMISFDEAIKNNLPVDKIGKCGTYSSYLIDVSTLPSNWFNELSNMISNYFMEKLRIRSYKISLTHKNRNGEETTLVPKPFKIPCTTAPYYDVWEYNTHIDFYGKHYKIKTLLRPDNKSDEMAQFDKDYSNHKAYKGYRDNIVLIFEDEDGYSYQIREMKVSGGRTPRGVIKVIVDKKDLMTDMSKNVASLKKGDGKTTDIGSENKKIFELYDKLYPSRTVVEDDLRDQLINILWGVEWPKGFSFLQYKELCSFLNIPVGDYTWAKVNVKPNHPTLHKKLDVYIKEHDHVIELKPSEPDGDIDFNQITGYSAIVNPRPKKITTLGVSKFNPKKKFPMCPRGNFNPDLISKFTTDLNDHDTTKDIEWELGDLRYFQLHELAEETETVNA